jgi:SAM-dependent methyltransferase
MTFTQPGINTKEILENNTESVFPELDVIHIGTERLDGGAHLHYLKVEDESDKSPNKELWAERIEELDRRVSEHPEWLAPQVNNNELDLDSLNPASALLYGEGSPSLREWAGTMKYSKALTNLYYPFEDRFPGELGEKRGLFNGGEVDKNAKEYFLNGLDAIAIRTRARVFQQIMKRQVDSAHGRDLNWTSLACGSAIPLIEAAGNAKKAGGHVHANLVDIDDHALGFASQLAKNKGMDEGDNYDVMERNLVRDLVVSNKLADEVLPESQDMVDMIGIFEYFAKEGATKLLHNAYDLVKPGGTLVFANMLSSRPQKEFNQRCVGWPGLNMRSVVEILDVAKEAGVGPNQIDVFIPQDGVYAVAQVTKPLRLED